MGAEEQEPRCAQNGRCRHCVTREACAALLGTQPLCWLMGASPRGQLSLDVWLSNWLEQLFLSASFPPDLEPGLWLLVLTSWFPKYHGMHFYFLFLCFLEGRKACSSSLGPPMSLGAQPQYPSVAPLLLLRGPEMGWCSRGPAYPTFCSRRPERAWVRGPGLLWSMNQLWPEISPHLSSPRPVSCPCLDLTCLCHPLLLISVASPCCPA